MTEATLRLGAFLVIISLLSFFEFINPYREIRFFSKRKLSNIMFGILNTIVLRLVSVTGLVVIAEYADRNTIGLWNILSVNEAIAFTLSLLFFDLLIYSQHFLMHRWQLLWRLHRLHHTDLEFDATTALRFHPFEILLSFFIKAVAILAIGASVWAVIVFEILLSSFALFSHSNIQLPEKFESFLRKLIITPKFHRIHHSVKVKETNSNYAFNLTVWDYLFKTYVAKTQENDKKMPIGIEDFRSDQDQQLYKLILQPFQR